MSDEADKLVRHLTILEPELPTRPKTRGDCIDGPRPCPWISCRHNMFTDPEGKNLRLPYGGEFEPDKIPNTLCSLDYADHHSASRAEVEALLNVSRTVVKDAEFSGLRKLEAQSRTGRGLREFQIVVPREDHWDAIELMG